jgi:nucleoside-diphosphate-sugar epimerase
LGSTAKRALVTGANGFVGSYITEYLLGRGYQVRAMVRQTSDLSALENLDVELVFGDMTDPGSMPAAVTGMEIVFHVAGITRSKDPSRFEVVNARGTDELMRACLNETGIKRFVYISSQAAGGPATRNAPRKEDDPPAPVTAYGRSKRGGERACLETAAGRIPVTIVRPCIVYGPREPEGLSLFMTKRRGIEPAILPNICLSLIHAADLADLTERAGRLKIAENSIYNASDPEPYWMKRVVRVIGEVLDKRILLIPVNRTFLSLLTAANELLLKRGIGVQVLTRERIEDAMHRYWTMDVTKAVSELEWQPKATLEERIEETADWYRAEGLF